MSREREVLINEIVEAAVASGRQVTYDQVNQIIHQYERLYIKISQDDIHYHYMWELPGVAVFYTVKNSDSAHVRDKTRKRNAIKRIFRQTFNEVWKSLQNNSKSLLNL